MNYKINLGQWNKVFAVPFSVVSEHLKLANDDFVKVLLAILAYAGDDISNLDIGNICGVSDETVADAIAFWCNKGVLSLSDGVISPAENNIAHENNKIAPSLASKTPISTKSKEIKVTEKIKIKTKEPVRLNSFEISKRIDTTEELKWLVTESERMFGRFLTQTEISVLVSMFDYASIPADVIAMVIEYCISIDKQNFRFIEKTAYNWLDQGIDTHKKVEAHITSLTNAKNDEAVIKSAFGIYDRNLTTKQKEYIHVWLHGWGFNEEMLKLAYEMCVDNTGKISFPYINSVLSKWNDKSIKTPQDVKNNEIQRKSTGKPKKSNLDLSEFDSFENYTVPNLSKKKK